MQATPVRVLCVDDNEFVAESIQRRLSREPGFTWLGQLQSAENLLERCHMDRPDVVILDIDMPGKDPFDALREVSSECPNVRIIMLSGHVRRELIDRAVDSGAWGYLSKSEDTTSIIAAIRGVAEGKFTIGREAETEYTRR